MTVLVTRPVPNATTADALRERGITPLLAPLLQFRPLPFRDDVEAQYSGVIVTSANALRAIVAQSLLTRIKTLPAFAVGAQTAKALRDAGFGNVETASGDAGSLRKLLAKKKKTGGPLLYLRAEDVSTDLASDLKQHDIPVVSLAVYRMAQVQELPDDVLHAFSQETIDAVLHYSRRSAQAFVAAVNHAGIAVSALAIPQLCLSDAIAEVLRSAGASRVIAASAPNESALLDALARALK